ncbi:MAG: DUF456 domain-containing protein [Bacteroidales bacterium]|jgi:uncharacterized protein YqgC (DUF456 family)|nr:DUF456 domain-containing protein [Bacteroidales bacterium]MCI2144944.1 DUF456 domain-containing protein [Bacteroidales bacterium]
MDIFIQIMAVVLGLVGVIGSVLPVLPGIPVSWCGLLLLYLWGPNKATNPVTTKTLIVWLVVTAVVSVITYFIPAYFTKVTGGGKIARRGAMVGTIVGIFFGPLGIFLGSFIGAFLAEIIFNGKEFRASLKSAAGSIIGFILNTVITLTASAWLLLVIIRHL